MIRRWMMPVILSLALGMCLIAWVDGERRESELAYTRGHTLLAISCMGELRLYWFAKPFITSGFTSGWEWRHFPSSVGYESKSVYGFSIGKVDEVNPFSHLGGPPVVMNTYLFVGGPYWFFVLLAGVALAYWRRKMRKLDPAHAFPVDASSTK